MTFRFAIVTFTVFMFASCAPNIVGTWNVVRYETVDDGSQGTVLNNIGTITFNKKGIGEKNISYNLLGVQRNDTTAFTWRADEKFVTIQSDSSEFSKIWILMENSKKAQLWKATDGATQVQIIELKK
ncbi:MAG: hypothetical protein JXR27_03515 [Paludibacteraceae bacterium]|nr:hypothetical protein [Paludibacteraceae bacterium]